jgi:hypothetical protein
MPGEWEGLSSNEKHVQLLELALDRKREILSLPLPDKSDDSVEANRLRALVLSASDTTISQAISLRSLASAVGKNTVAEEVEPGLDCIRSQRFQLTVPR